MKTSQSGQKRNFSVEENLKRLQIGSVLLARDALQDPNFDTTVVLVSIHGEEGAYGLVLNRPSHMPLSEIFDGFTGLNLKREVYIGGPVQQEELQIVQTTDEPVEEAYQIGHRVFLGGKWESIGQMIETDPETTHLFLGYSGWAAGQLETEIQAGAWDVYRLDLEVLLTSPQAITGATTAQIGKFLESISAE